MGPTLRTFSIQNLGDNETRTVPSSFASGKPGKIQHMKRQDTHYQTLGVKPGVTSQEIKRAYRQLVKSLHPDVENNEEQGVNKESATERMMRLNEAYETLKDRSKRKAYDCLIGLNRGLRGLPAGGALIDEEESREIYLKQVFQPSRQAILRLLNLYPRQLARLSLDIYDVELVNAFHYYCDKVEAALRQASMAFAADSGPRSLKASVQLMRYSIAQAADGLEEMRRFCQNYDYNHLILAGNLFRIANDLSKEALRLTR